MKGKKKIIDRINELRAEKEKFEKEYQKEREEIDRKINVKNESYLFQKWFESPAISFLRRMIEDCNNEIEILLWVIDEEE